MEEGHLQGYFVFASTMSTIFAEIVCKLFWLCGLTKCMKDLVWVREKLLLILNQTVHSYKHRLLYMTVHIGVFLNRQK